MKKIAMVMAAVAVLSVGSVVSAHSLEAVSQKDGVVALATSQWVCQRCGKVVNQGNTNYPNIGGWCMNKSQQRHVFQRVK